MGSGYSWDDTEWVVTPVVTKAGIYPSVYQTGVWVLLWTDILSTGHPWSNRLEFSQLCCHKL